MLQQPSVNVPNNKEANSTNIIFINQHANQQNKIENYSLSKNLTQNLMETNPKPSSSRYMLNESKYVYKTPCNPKQNDEPLIKK